MAPAVNYFIGGIYLAFGLKNPFSQIIYFIIYFCGFISYFYRITPQKLAAITIFLLLLCISCYWNPGLFEFLTEEPNLYQSRLITFILSVFPIFLISSNNKFNLNNCLNKLYRATYVTNSMCIATFSLQIMSGEGLNEYMAFAYTSLPSIMLGLYFGAKKRDLIGFCLAALAMTTIIFGGCRGALFTLVIFILLNFSSLSTKKKIIVSLFTFALILIGLTDIFDSTTNLLSQYGYKSRILESFLSNDIENSSGRDLLYAKAFALIDPFGRGIFSDRILLNHFLDATYCHNWIIEMMVDYGYILGSIVVLMIIGCMIYLFSKKTVRDNIDVRFILVFGSSLLLGKYMLSNSYLQGADFAFTIGTVISIMSKLKHNRFLNATTK